MHKYAIILPENGKIWEGLSGSNQKENNINKKCKDERLHENIGNQMKKIKKFRKLLAVL